MAGREHLGGDLRQKTKHDAAKRRAQPDRNPGLAHRLLDERHEPHDEDAGAGANDAEEQHERVVAEIHGRHRDRHHEGGLPQSARDQRAHEGRNRDGRERRDRVKADDQLEGISRGRERCVEGGRDRARGPATDEGAQVIAAQPEELAEARGDARADLGIAGLEPDGGTKAVRDHVLEGDDEAVCERQPSAMERIRLDRVDRDALTPLRIGPENHAEHGPAHGGGEERGEERQARRAAHPRVRVDVEDQAMRDHHDIGHAANEGAGKPPGDGRERGEPHLARAHQGAQMVGCAAQAEGCPRNRAARRGDACMEMRTSREDSVEVHRRQNNAMGRARKPALEGSSAPKRLTTMNAMIFMNGR